MLSSGHLLMCMLQNDAVASGLAVLDTPVTQEDRVQAWGAANTTLARANRKEFKRKMERYKANAVLDSLAGVHHAQTVQLGLQNYDLTACPDMSRCGPTAVAPVRAPRCPEHDSLCAAGAGSTT